MTIFDSIRYPIVWPNGSKSLRWQLEPLPEELVQQYRHLLLNPKLEMILPKFWPSWTKATVGHSSVCMGCANYVISQVTADNRAHSIDLLRWLILHYEDECI